MGGPGDRGGQEEVEQALEEMRERLVMGLKRFFHQRRMEGLLSSAGLGILDDVCHHAIFHSDQSGPPVPHPPQHPNKTCFATREHVALQHLSSPTHYVLRTYPGLSTQRRHVPAPLSCPRAPVPCGRLVNPKP